MVIASQSPAWLHTLGQIAGTILVIELSIALLIVAALAVGLALGMRWAQQKVLPIIDENAPRIINYMNVAEQGSDRVARGVAEFYGRRQAVRTGLRVMLFGRGAAQRVREDSAIETAADLQAISADETTLDPEDGFTPQLGFAHSPIASSSASQVERATSSRPREMAIERPQSWQRESRDDMRDGDHHLPPVASSAG